MIDLQKDCTARVFCLSPNYPQHRFFMPRTYAAQSFGRPFSIRRRMPGVWSRSLSLPVLTRPFNAFTAGRLAKAHIASWCPDAILAYFIYPQGCAAASIGRRLNIPVILGARGSDLLRISDPLAKWQISKALQSAAAVTGVSRDLVDHAIALGADPEHAVCIPNGCHSSIFYPRDKRACPAELSPVSAKMSSTSCSWGVWCI